MTLFFYYDGAGIGDLAVRLGSGFALAECAEAGVVATSTVQIDDPSGALNIVGLKSFRMVETASSWQRGFTGYVADRTLARADSLLTGAARRWDAAVLDANSALNFRALRGSAANRPAETDAARIAWWLGSGFAAGISDTGYVDTSGAVSLDACDYRGRFGADLLADCSTTSGKNYFVAYDEAAGGLALHYYASSSSLWTCSVKVSNVAADVDQATVFVASEDAKLSRDPSRVYSGVYLAYGDGSASVYVSDSGTASAFAARDYSTVDTTVKSSSGATAKANKLQNQSSSEYDRITCTLRKVPAAYLNLIRTGQRIQVKFTHLPGYTSYTYIRIARRTVRQATSGLYELDLELANTKAIRGSGGHAPAPSESTPTLALGTALTLSTKEASQGYGQALLAFSYGTVGSPFVGSWVSPNTPYTTCGCPLGAGGWGPGRLDHATFWEFTPSMGATDVGIQFTWSAGGSPLGRGADSNACAYVVVAPTGGPGSYGDWVRIGVVSLATGGTFVVPRGLLTDGVVNVVGLEPCWLADGTFFACAQDLVNGASGPVAGGEGNSGRVNAPSASAGYVSLSGAGAGPWVAGIGAVNGSNAAFQLVGWSGTGSVQCSINGIIQPDTCYTLNTATLTATLDAPPQPYDVVLWKYRVAS